jgi:hypothetical protein
MKLTLFLLSLNLWAQLEPPSLGTMLDSAGAARHVTGVAFAATLGDPLAANVTSLACTAAVCAAQTDASLIFWNANTRKEIPDSGGPAQFAFDADSVYILQSGMLTVLQGAGFARAKIHSRKQQITGDILAMRITSGIPEFAVRRADGVWIVCDGDIAVTALPADGPVLLLPDAILYASGDETVLRRADATEIRFPVRADAFIAMSDRTVQIRSGPSSFALRLDSEKLFQLPEAQ